MRFEEAYTGWRKNTREEASRLLGVSDRTFRRYHHRYEKDGSGFYLRPNRLRTAQDLGTVFRQTAQKLGNLSGRFCKFSHLQVAQILHKEN